MLTDFSALLVGLGASTVPAALLGIIAIFRRVYRDVLIDVAALLIVSAVALNSGLTSVFLMGEHNWERLISAFGFSVGCVLIALLRALVTPHQDYWSCLALLAPALLAKALMVALYIFMPVMIIPGGTIAGFLGVWGARKATKESHRPFLGFLWGCFCGVAIVSVVIVPASLFPPIFFLALVWTMVIRQLRK